MPIVICPCGEDVALLSCRHFTTIDVDDMDTCTSWDPDMGTWVDVHSSPRMAVQILHMLKSRGKLQVGKGSWSGLMARHTSAPTKMPSCTDAPMKCAITPAAMMNRKISTMPPARAHPRNAHLSYLCTCAGPLQFTTKPLLNVAQHCMQ